MVAYSCIFVPIRLSFLSDQTIDWIDIVDYVVNVIFALDMLATFFSAHFDNNLNLITDRRVALSDLENSHELPDGLVRYRRR